MPIPLLPIPLTRAVVPPESSNASSPPKSTLLPLLTFTVLISIPLFLVLRLLKRRLSKSTLSLNWLRGKGKGARNRLGFSRLSSVELLPTSVKFVPPAQPISPYAYAHLPRTASFDTLPRSPRSPLKLLHSATSSKYPTHRRSKSLTPTSTRLSPSFRSTSTSISTSASAPSTPQAPLIDFSSSSSSTATSSDLGTHRFSPVSDSAPLIPGIPIPSLPTTTTTTTNLSTTPNNHTHKWAFDLVDTQDPSTTKLTDPLLAIFKRQTQSQSQSEPLIQFSDPPAIELVPLTRRNAVPPPPILPTGPVPVLQPFTSPSPPPPPPPPAPESWSWDSPIVSPTSTPIHTHAPLPSTITTPEPHLSTTPAPAPAPASASLSLFTDPFADPYPPLSPATTTTTTKPIFTEDTWPPPPEDEYEDEPTLVWEEDPAETSVLSTTSDSSKPPSIFDTPPSPPPQPSSLAFAKTQVQDFCEVDIRRVSRFEYVDVLSEHGHEEHEYEHAVSEDCGRILLPVEETKISLPEPELEPEPESELPVVERFSSHPLEETKVEVITMDGARVPTTPVDVDSRDVEHGYGYVEVHEPIIALSSPTMTVAEHPRSLEGTEVEPMEGVHMRVSTPVVDSWGVEQEQGYVEVDGGGNGNLAFSDPELEDSLEETEVGFVESVGVSNADDGLVVLPPLIEEEEENNKVELRDIELPRVVEPEPELEMEMEPTGAWDSKETEVVVVEPPAMVDVDIGGWDVEQGCEEVEVEVDLGGRVELSHVERAERVPASLALEPYPLDADMDIGTHGMGGEYKRGDGYGYGSMGRAEQEVGWGVGVVDLDRGDRDYDDHVHQDAHDDGYDYNNDIHDFNDVHDRKRDEGEGGEGEEGEKEDEKEDEKGGEKQVEVEAEAEAEKQVIMIKDEDDKDQEEDEKEDEENQTPISTEKESKGVEKDEDMADLPGSFPPSTAIITAITPLAPAHLPLHPRPAPTPTQGSGSSSLTLRSSSSSPPTPPPRSSLSSADAHTTALSATTTTTTTASSPPPLRLSRPRSALDLALAMQLRPGLGPGADPAWMVRFLMSVFGWFIVVVSGGLEV